MGLQWDCNGTSMGLQWDCNGTAMSCQGYSWTAFGRQGPPAVHRAKLTGDELAQQESLLARVTGSSEVAKILFGTKIDVAKEAKLARSMAAA
eukprot:10156364-Lingulodinium_polyedra.AAC.1